MLVFLLFITDDSRDPRGRRGSVERHENFQSKSPNGVSLFGGIFSGAIESPAVRTIVAVVPLVQAGYYFGFELDPGAHKVQFGATFFEQEQDVTYNILNPIIGTNEKDTLTGTPENDYIDGGNGKDFLSGKAGNDLMLGGNDKDTIDGGTGNDELWGDNDKDTFIYQEGYGEDTIFDFKLGEVSELVLL